MTDTLSKLKILPVNKTVVFFSPAEGEDVLVRTGIIQDNDSFFHSVVHAISKEYITMNESDRLDFTKTFKKNIILKTHDDLDSKEFKNMFEDKFIFIVNNFYKFINTDSTAKGKTTKKVIKKVIGKDEDKLQYFTVITQLIPYDILKNLILESFKDTENTSEYTVVIIKKVLKHYVNIKEIKELDKDIRDTIQLLLEELIFEIFHETNKVVTKSFNDNLINTVKIEKKSIELFSKYLERDIYFINSNTRLPIKYQSYSTKYNKKTLIIMAVENEGKIHYEVVGKLLPGNRVQREFSNEDELIKKIYEFTYNPQNISKTYPELKDYLPEEFKSPTKKLLTKDSPKVSPSPTQSPTLSPSLSSSPSPSPVKYPTPSRSPEEGEYEDDEEEDLIAEKE
jgi:hypothetical protein